VSSLGRMAKAMALQEHKDKIAQAILDEIQRQAKSDFAHHFQVLSGVPKIVYEGTIDIDGLTHAIIEAVIHLI
jgi:hypothetical protein